MANPDEKFSFCIGRPWSTDPTNLCVYAYGTQVHHGTRADAEEYKAYHEASSGEELQIYKIVPLSPDD